MAKATPQSSFHHVIDVMIDLIAKRLHQNLTALDATNMVFHFEV